MMHPFHLVQMSPWPLMLSFSIFSLTIGLILWFFLKSLSLLFCSMVLITFVSFFWWRDIVRESTYFGFHTTNVLVGLRLGMILFIVSEVMFFFSFFWAFLHSSLSPNVEIGMLWPPVGIETFDPLFIPLLNTTILLSSGVTVTWAHHSIMGSKYPQTFFALMYTLFLGLYFTFLQYFEYKHSSFSISDSIYGSTFFVSTGFHGLHVIVGSAFLLVCFFRLLLGHFSCTRHFGFEAAIWYWHFVDVVWLFLYSMIYCWGN